MTDSNVPPHSGETLEVVLSDVKDWCIDYQIGCIWLVTPRAWCAAGSPRNHGRCSPDDVGTRSLPCLNARPRRYRAIGPHESYKDSWASTKRKFELAVRSLPATQKQPAAYGVSQLCVIEHSSLLSPSRLQGRAVAALQPSPTVLYSTIYKSILAARPRPEGQPPVNDGSDTGGEYTEVSACAREDPAGRAGVVDRSSYVIILETGQRQRALSCRMQRA